MKAVCGIVSTGMLNLRTAGSVAMAAALVASSASLFFSPGMAGPIHDAVKAGDQVQVEQLIATGTDVDERDGGKKTALHWAAELGHIEIAQLLVANGADVNAKDFADYTVLHGAGYYDREVIAGLLIDNGADVTALDQEGISVLDRPVMQGFTGMIEMLQRAGAECGTNDYQSKTCRRQLGIK